MQHTTAKHELSVEQNHGQTAANIWNRIGRSFSRRRALELRAEFPILSYLIVMCGELSASQPGARRRDTLLGLNREFATAGD